MNSKLARLLDLHNEILKIRVKYPEDKRPLLVKKQLLKKTLEHNSLAYEISDLLNWGVKKAL